jgi:protein TonB
MNLAIVFPRTRKDTRGAVTPDPQLREQATAEERSIERRWVALSLLLHALLLAALIGWWRAAVPEHVQRLTVVLAPGSAGAAGGGGGEASSDSQAASAPPAAKAPTPAPPAPSPPQPETQAQPEPPSQDTAPPVLTSAAPNATEAPPPHPERKPAHAQPAPPEAVAAKPPPPQPAPEPQPQEQTAATAPAAAPADTAAAPAAPGAGPAAGPGAGDAQSGPGHGMSGNNPGAGDDWLNAARKRLFSVMTNPNAGREHPLYGTALVAITVARDGRVLDAQIDKSSGIPYLDQSALQMVHDASPLPPLPDGIAGDSVSFTVPAEYAPGLFERLFH